jgi:DNA-binding MarR family transcriptional regulator
MLIVSIFLSIEEATPLEAIGYLLKNAQHSLRTAMDAALRSLGVTTPQYAVLTFLAEAPGLSSAQLARRAFVTPQTMNRIVANLEVAGLVERDPHPELGRVLETSLTNRGRRLLAECQQRIDEVEAHMVADLTPAERRQLAHLLECCTRALRPARERSSRGP